MAAMKYLKPVAGHTVFLAKHKTYIFPEEAPKTTAALKPFRSKVTKSANIPCLLQSAPYRL
jgi:hypothetical protein